MTQDQNTPCRFGFVCMSATRKKKTLPVDDDAACSAKKRRRLDDCEHQGSSIEECDRIDYDINASDDDDDDDDDTNTPRPKPYFVYLMACSAAMKNAQRRNHTHIGKSRDAVRKVRLHNEGRVNSGKRSTRTSAPHWRLEQWIGPFDTRLEARQFQRSWFRNTKGIKLRINRGVQLASMHKLRCYTPRALLGGKGAIKHSDDSVTKEPCSES